MVPLEYQVRLQAKPQVNKKANKQTESANANQQAGKRETEAERSINQKSKSELATFSDIER